MATLALGPDGEQTCEECAYAFCSTWGHICETDGCECYCKVRPLTTEHFDTAPTTAFPRTYEELRRERFGLNGWPRRSAA